MSAAFDYHFPARMESIVDSLAQQNTLNGEIASRHHQQMEALTEELRTQNLITYLQLLHDRRETQDHFAHDLELTIVRRLGLTELPAPPRAGAAS